MHGLIATAHPDPHSHTYHIVSQVAQGITAGGHCHQRCNLIHPNGQKVWVHGKATEQMAEYAASKAENCTPEAVRLASQTELRSF